METFGWKFTFGRILELLNILLLNGSSLAKENMEAIRDKQKKKILYLKFHLNLF